jgi:hypothetical protein
MFLATSFGTTTASLFTILITTTAIASANATTTYVCVERKSVGWAGNDIGAIKPDENQFVLRYQPPGLDESKIISRVGSLEKVAQVGLDLPSLFVGDSACDELLRGSVAVMSAENRKALNSMCGSSESGHNFSSAANGQSWTFFPSLSTFPTSVTYVYSLVANEQSSFMSSGTCVLAK